MYGDVETARVYQPSRLVILSDATDPLLTRAEFVWKSRGSKPEQPNSATAESGTDARYSRIGSTRLSSSSVVANEELTAATAKARRRRTGEAESEEAERRGLRNCCDGWGGHADRETVPELARG